ncbi:hypothetical protein PHISP_07596 [Aspergillus sp. HF37]|nr:hypothetical protein PHISP_07596 [Aspergillus sp. HF37]
MAPTKGAKGSAKAKPSSDTKPSALSSSSSSSRVSKKNAGKRPPPQEQKSKARTEPGQLKKTKKRQYTEDELDLPKLNMITPAGVVKPRGKKKGKTFVDDQDGMATILAMVNADKEGQIESKMMKARQLEEIRDAKRREAEARQTQKKSKLDEAKDSIRNKRKHKSDDSQPKPKAGSAPSDDSSSKSKGKRKSVAFA